MKYNSLSNKSCALKNNSKIFKLAFAVLFLGLFFGFSTKASAATYYINGSGSSYVGVQGTYGVGSDTTGNGTLATPWATLNKCVSSGSANDTCYIAAGSYTQTWIDSKGLVWIADGTVTVLPASASVFSASGGSPSLTGFTLNGNGTATYGINVSGGTVVTATNCSISGLATGGSAVYRSSATAISYQGGTVSGSNVLAAVFYISGGNGSFTVDSTNVTVPAQRLFLDADVSGTKTFNNVTANMAISGSGKIFNLFAMGNIVISGGSYTFSGTPTSWIAINNGAGSGSLTVSGFPTVSFPVVTSAPIVSITVGSHPVDISANITASNPAQNQNIIYIADQPQPRVHDSIIDTRGVVGDISHSSTTHINIVSTGATVGAARIDHNISYSQLSYGNVYMIGNDTTGAGNGKLSGSRIDHNAVYGPLYYDRTITTCGLHGAEIGWSGAGTIDNNYFNGTGYGPIIKSNGTDYANANGIYSNLVIDVGGTSATSGQGGILVKGAQNVPVYNNTAFLSSGYKTATGLVHIYTNNDAGNHYAASAILNNNILVADSSVPLIYLGTAGDAADNASLTANYNLYYTRGGAFNVYAGATSSTYNTFSSWQSAGYDANGKFLDPQFVSSSNFSLQNTSPAINSATNVGLTIDYAGNTVPSGPLPDIGAYEYQDVSAPTGGSFENNDDEKDLNLHNLKSSSTENSITLTWKTDHNTESTIRYGIDKNLKVKKKDSQKEKKHRVVLKDLLPNTKYYFRIKATDSDDNEDSSKIHSVTLPKAIATQTGSPSQNEDQPQAQKETSSGGNTSNTTPNICLYTVESSDTLWSIAKKVYGDTTAYLIIIEKNKDKYPDIKTKLPIGQELTFCDNNQNSQTTESNPNTDNSLPTGQADSQQNQTQPQPEPQPSTFRWWNPFTWF